MPELQEKKIKSENISSFCSGVVEYSVTSPVGSWSTVQCTKGLHGLKLGRGDDNSENSSPVDPNLKVQLVQSKVDLPDNSYFMNWVYQYFNNVAKCQEMDVPAVCPGVFEGNSFRQKVWHYIYRHVGFGETMSYGGVAAAIGSNKAAQAVGSAMKNNPVPLVIPCHRVIKSGGEVGHYDGGKRDSLKVWMLDHEKST